MTLDRITFTGADDSTDPEALVDLSAEFPIVEWGILFSSSQQGRYRFPSEAWLHRLSDALTPGMRLSAHLCGRWVRDLVLDGNFTWPQAYPYLCEQFERVQLNFHGEFHRAADRFPGVLELNAGQCQFILQCDGVNDAKARELAARGLGVPLFDTSGGAGIVPRGGWPSPWRGVYCGYAGGLGPHNIAAQMEVIARTVGASPFWIDMERRVRSEDDSTFDLAKVRAVLAAVQEKEPSATSSNPVTPPGAQKT